MRTSTGRAMAALVATVLAASGCTSTLNGHGSAATTDAPSFPATPPSTSVLPSVPVSGSNATLSADQLEAAAKHALVTARAWRMSGTIQDSSGSTIALNMHYGPSSSNGTITVDGVHVSLRYVAPDLYMQGDAHFWRTAGGLSNSSADQTALGFLLGKWVHIPPGTPGLSDLGSLAIRSKFVEHIAGSADSGPFSRGPSKQINGVPAVSFVDASDHSTVYVPVSGTAYPIRIEGSGGSDGALDFTAWNAPFAAPRPAAGEIFELPR